jgi:hypothetical protein
MPLDKTPDDYLEMTEDELKRRKEAFEAYKLQQEVQETLKWKWITKLESHSLRRKRCDTLGRRVDFPSGLATTCGCVLARHRSASKEK